jgi:phage shock protein E
MYKKVAIIPAILILAATLTGCSTSPAPVSQTGGVASNIFIDQYDAIIDVRTEEEWDEGNLNGAVRIGLEDSTFTEEIGKLDKSKSYYLYCRSGNRADQAIQIMREMGFYGDLVNGGAVADASLELGLEIIRY